MIEGRKELRHPETFHLQLSSTADVSATESPLTVNVSSRGMRVRTGHSWEPGRQTIVKSLVRNFAALARIVYFQSLPGNAFAVGLEFLASTDTRAVR